MDKKEFESIKVGNFKIRYYKKNPKLEAKIVFEREHLSQKLIFSLMDIVYRHSLCCSSPQFTDISDEDLYFYITLPLSSTRALTKGLEKIHLCLKDIKKFSNNFFKQLNFDTLDLSMFLPQDGEKLYPEQISALRDQQYGGSWKKMYEEFVDLGQKEEAELILRCIEFEKKNNKDLGFVGFQLSYMLGLLLQMPKSMDVN